MESRLGALLWLVRVASPGGRNWAVDPGPVELQERNRVEKVVEAVHYVDNRNMRSNRLSNIDLSLFYLNEWT